MRQKASLTLSILGLLAGFSNFALGFEFGGFGDVRYRESTNKENPVRNGFAKGLNLDLYASHPISDRSSVLVEIAFHPNGDDAVHVERAQVDYAVADYLKIRAGRFHAPIGYWNVAYHHGAQLQTTIDRPIFLEYEHFAALLPMHSNGLWLDGSWRSDEFPALVHYGLTVANGSTIISMPSDMNMKAFQNNTDRGMMPMAAIDPQDSGSVNPSKSTGFYFDINPDAVRGLTVGLSGYQHHVTGEYSMGAMMPATTLDVGQHLLAAYLHYANHRWEVISEWYAVFDTDNMAAAGAQRHYSNRMAYVQASYELIPDRLLGYARYERTTIDYLDPYFTGLNGGPSYHWTEGLRLNIAQRTSTKFEIRQNRQWAVDHSNSYIQYAWQWAFSF